MLQRQKAHPPGSNSSNTKNTKRMARSNYGPHRSHGSKRNRKFLLMAVFIMLVLFAVVPFLLANPEDKGKTDVFLSHPTLRKNKEVENKEVEKNEVEKKQVAEEKKPSVEGIVDAQEEAVASKKEREKNAAPIIINKKIEGKPDYSDVVATLMKLALLSPDALRQTIGVEQGDYFSLGKLESEKTCPFHTQPEWLPTGREGTERTSYHWTHRLKPARKGNRNKDPVRTPETSDVPVGVWYDHLSKAGGTSFCQMADERMGRVEIPSYHCMPSEPGNPDARVGQWPNDKLIQYFHSSGKHLVSNEWEPFPLNKFELQAQSENELLETKGNTAKLWLLFITTIREPLDRLLSAHKFWGVLHNNENPHPTFEKWLERRLNIAKQDFGQPKRGLGKLGSKGENFLAMVGRPNFATWKFSGGTLPVLPDKTNTLFPVSDQKWQAPFAVAIETLSRFDLVIPMELLSKHPQPLNDLLGWEHDVEAAHVVTVGKIHNNNARAELSNEDKYNTLWDANRLDMILYHWTKAVYLTRLLCEG